MIAVYLVAGIQVALVLGLWLVERPKHLTFWLLCLCFGTDVVLDFHEQRRTVHRGSAL